MIPRPPRLPSANLASRYPAWILCCAYTNARRAAVVASQDSGVRAFVSGLAVASSQVMIGSSLNDPRTKDILDAYRCEKPYSGYITLITEWREEILHKEPETVVRMFPFEYPPPSEAEEEPAPQPEPEPVGEP